MIPHDLLANFEIMAEAPNGIPRLRELMLELAVRGKLVEQNPDDGDAAALVSRIRSERAAYQRNHKGRVSKPLDPVCEDEMPFSLPNGWKWVRFGDVFLDIITGPFGSSLHASDYVPGGIPVVNPQNLQGGNITPLVSTAVSQETVARLSSFQIEHGDILVARRGEMGRCAVATNIQAGWLCGTGCLILRPSSWILPSYLAMFIGSPGTRDRLINDSVGSTMNNLNQRILINLAFALPPREEQRRILTRVDELMAHLYRLEAKRQEREAARCAARESALDALCEAPTLDDVENAWQRIQERFHQLFATPEDVEPLRQAILQLAVAGRLVPQDSNDTNAMGALQKIQECRRQWIKIGKMRAGKPFPAISEAEIPFQIPEGWALARLGDVLSDIQPGWSPQCEGGPRVGVGWGVLKVSACSWGRFLPEENKALPAGMEVPPEIEVQPGDWIISRANTTELVGRSVLASECPPHLLLSDKTLRLVPMPGFSPRWGNLVNHAPSSRTHYAAKAGGTSASMRNISQDVIRSLIIAIPPIEEQERIHSKFEALIAILDRLAESLNLERNLAGAFAEAAVHHLEV